MSRIQKIASIVCILLIMLSSSSIYAQSVTLNNAGFETFGGSFPSSWYLSGSATTSRNTTTKRTGASSLQLSGSYICQDAVTPYPGSYQFSVWTRSASGTVAANPSIGLSPSISSIGGNSAATVGTTWVQLSVTIYLPGTSATVCIYTLDTQAALWDDATLTYTGSVIPTSTPAPTLTPSIVPTLTPTLVVLVTPTPTPIPYAAYQTELQKQSYLWQLVTGITVMGLLVFIFIRVRT